MKERETQGLVQFGAFGRKNSKLGYSQQFMNGKYSAPQPDPFAEKIDLFVRAFERVCTKLENTLDNQNRKILQMQSTFSEVLITRLDKLITVNQKVYESMERVHSNSNGKQSTEKSQVISRNILGEPLGVSLACKSPKSLKQSIISLNKDQQVKAITSTLPPLPNLEKCLSLDKVTSITPRGSMRQADVLEQNDHSHQLAKVFQPLLSPGGGRAVETAVLSLALNTVHSFDLERAQFSKSLGNFYNGTAATYFQLYSTNKMSYQDMKIKFSYDIINEALNLSQKWFELCKNRSDNSQDLKLVTRRAEFYHMHNYVSKNCLQFLISKYPPSRRKKIDTELSEKIKNTNKKFSVVKYDMLFNANMDIGLDESQSDFSKQIKTWLNTLVKETKKEFPRFKDKMKDIFINVDYSVEGLKDMNSELEFVIGTKISEGTALFTPDELKAPGLQIKSTQLLRILMKWCEQLTSYFIKPEQKIYGNTSGFKTVKNGALPIKIPKSRLDQLVANLKDIYDNEVLPDLKAQGNNVGFLVTDLVNLTLEGVNGYEYLEQREISIVKMSDYLNESLKAHVLNFLNLVLSKLVKVRKRYQDQKLESKLHLITFGVMDLLRCRCVGSKAQIYRIYKRILENSQYFEIIRVKNKLNQPTRDIIINLKIKQSFLICQVQLSLGEAQQEVNDHFCHFLYELERTNFGVLFECASQICNLDPRMQFVESNKDICFKGASQKKTLIVQNVKSYDNRITCQVGHQETTMQFMSNDRPFCCTMCTKFRPGYSLCLTYLRCPICGISICPQCIIMISKNHSEFIQKYTSNGSDFKNLMRFFYTKHLYQDVGNSDLAELKIPSLLQKYLYILHMIVDNVGHKPIMYKRYKDTFIEAFSTLKGMINSTKPPFCWNYLIALKPCERKMLSELKNYRKFHINMEWSQLQEILKQNGIDEVMVVIDQESKFALIVDIIEVEEKIQSCLLRRQVQKTISETNRLRSNFLELTSKKLPDIDSLAGIDHKSEIKVLNLWQNKIKNIDRLQKFVGLQELFLRQNQIQSIDPILGMRELELAFLSNNKIKGALPVLKFPNLTAIDISLNLFSNMDNMSKSDLRNLVFFRMVNTKINEIPIMSLPKLETFWFDHNDISSVENFFKSQIPELTKVSGTHNIISGELPQLHLPKLDSLILNSNQISSIQRLSQSTCPSLRNLSLHHNAISGPLPMMVLPNLIKLDLSYNKISCLPVGILINTRFNSLESLDLKCNQISGDLPIMQLKSLRKMDVSNNLITSIQLLGGSKMPSLQLLDLDKNTIKGPLPMLRFLKLKKLILSNNELTDIKNLGQSKIPKISVVKLNNNKIKSTIPKMAFQHLRSIDLSHNSIPSEEFLDYIHLLPSLEKVHLFDNDPSLKEQVTISHNLETQTLLDFQGVNPQ